MDIQKREKFEALWLQSGGNFKYFEFNAKAEKYLPTGVKDSLTDNDLICTSLVLNTAYLFYLGGFKQANTEITLDKPAQVGGTKFGIGIKWQTVIECAQRHHINEQSRDKTQERQNLDWLKKLISGEYVLVPTSLLNLSIQEIEDLFQRDSLEALGGFLGIREAMRELVESQEQSHE